MSTVKQVKQIPGIISCILEHEITKTKAHFDWTGPKISPQVWQQVLAFFKWTYDEHRSESQVRLFVNATEWQAWAFPQKERTGMTAEELPDLPEYKEQRAKFGDDWQYFGTVHHHCGGSAFQSGVDLANEKGQDGLHITIGKMDEKMHDMHARLYISGHQFEPKMNWFWDTETYFASIPKDMKMFLVEGVEDRLARAQMCVPVTKEVEFPEQWRKNVIEIKPAKVETGYSGGLGYTPSWQTRGESDWHGHYYKSNKTPSDVKYDLWKARKEVLEFFRNNKDKNLQKCDVIGTIQMLDDFPYIIHLFENLYRNDVSLKGLIDYMLEKEKEEAAKEDHEKKHGKNKKKDKGNGGLATQQDGGVPDYVPTEQLGYPID